MKYKLLILAIGFVVFFSSCSSSYKTSQTPDDVYYSPVQLEKVDSEEKSEITNNKKYFDYNYLNQKVRNRNRWQMLDDFDYWHDTRYNYCNCNCNNFNTWNSYYNGWQNPYLNNTFVGFGWNNPYYVFVPYTHPTIKTGSTFGSNVLAYTNPTYNNTNYFSNIKTGYTQGVNNSNNTKIRTKRNASFGEIITNPTRIFSGSGSSSTPSSSAGGNSGGFNSSGSSTSKPRGGN